MDRAENYVVSPYLQSIPEEEVSAYIGATGDSALRGKLRERSSAEDVVLLFDMLEPRIVALSRPDAKRLDRLRSDTPAIHAFMESEPEMFARLRDHRLLLLEDQAFRRHSYKSIEIETNRHCNFRCVFCPVAAEPKPKGTMTQEVYEKVLGRVKEYGSFMVSLTFYSEPTLDPNLCDNIATAAKFGLAVRLHTNASLFDEEKIARIAALGQTWLVVNLPSVDKAEFERVTQVKMFDRVVENLKLLHKYKVPVTLSINSPRDGADGEVGAINDMFASMFGPSVKWPTDSRAGRISSPEYASVVRHSGLLGGCGIATIQLNVNWEGKAFLCCQDYQQELVLGDLREQSIKEIAESDRAVQIRKWVFGYDPAPPGFLCTKCEWTEPLRHKTRSTALAVGSPFKRDLVWPGGLTPDIMSMVPIELT